MLPSMVSVFHAFEVVPAGRGFTDGTLKKVSVSTFSLVFVFGCFSVRETLSRREET